MSDYSYKGLREPEPIKAIVTGVCPSSATGIALFSKEAAEFFQESENAETLCDIWELVNRDDTVQGTILWRGVSVDDAEKLISEREKMGIPTQRFLSHRVF